MKKEFLPYYFSRAIISVLFAVVMFRFTWQALLAALFLYGMFLLYLHSGWFKIDLTYPLFPLRRDQRSELIQRKALVATLVVGILASLALPLLFGLTGLGFLARNLAIPLAIFTYFSVQFFLLSRA